jgi:hypothetical protein
MRAVDNRIRLAIGDLKHPKRINIPHAALVSDTAPEAPREIRLRTQRRQV